MKQQFGFSAIKHATPLWAKWLFRVVFVITTALAFWVGGTAMCGPQMKAEILLALKALDMVVYGFSKMFGVKIKDES